MNEEEQTIERAYSIERIGARPRRPAIEREEMQSLVERREWRAAPLCCYRCREPQLRLIPVRGVGFCYSCVIFARAERRVRGAL